MKRKIIAVTACATGVAHTYMAAQALKKASKKMGHLIKVETQGATGIDNELTTKDAQIAEVVIFAVDTKVRNAERFEGKEILEVPVNAPIKETVALLSKLDVDKHIDVEIKLDELDLTSAESKATYAQIKEYVLEKFGLKVSTLYIAQIKKKCGIELREHYNKSKKDNQAIPQCTPEKEEAIMDALRHFKMI